jgi:putative DeoR family transcriptional regulator (stage III sporulation protein D)
LNNSNELQERAIILGRYIVEKGVTVRACAKEFGISKSTVHKDVTQNLKTLQPSLYAEVKKVLDKNKSERHIRGGLATKLKYQRLKELNNTNVM